MYREGTDSKVKARHTVECREEEEVMEELGPGGWWRRYTNTSCEIVRPGPIVLQSALSHVVTYT